MTLRSKVRVEKVRNEGKQVEGIKTLFSIEPCSQTIVETFNSVCQQKWMWWNVIFSFITSSCSDSEPLSLSLNQQIFKHLSERVQSNCTRHLIYMQNLIHQFTHKHNFAQLLCRRMPKVMFSASHFPFKSMISFWGRRIFSHLNLSVLFWAEPPFGCLRYIYRPIYVTQPLDRRKSSKLTNSLFSVQNSTS